jgi:hypothetical protein
MPTVGWVACPKGLSWVHGNALGWGMSSSISRLAHMLPPQAERHLGAQIQMHRRAQIGSYTDYATAFAATCMGCRSC